MPTSTNVTNLKINELKEAQYDTAVQQGVIGANELSILTDVDAGQVIQVATLPTAGADELGKIYQFVGTTDANYTNGYFYECVSDGQATPTYSWTQKAVQPSSGGLPSQTGNAGKFLTTDGTDASWSDKPLVNTATGTGNSINILGYGTTGSNSVSIGNSSTTGGSSDCLALGASAQSTANSVAVGFNAVAGNQYAVVVGRQSTGNMTKSVVVGASSVAYPDSGTGENGIAIGYKVKSGADHAIQIGNDGTNNRTTNSDANTVKIANANGNFEMMSADGTIPTDRLIHAINKYSTMPTAASTNLGWIVQFTGTTDSTYTHGHLYECVSDGQDPATYSWEEVSMGGGSSLPSQTGNAGKFLTTDGTDASWSDKPLVNNSSNTTAIAIGGNSSAHQYSTAIGESAITTKKRAVAVGQGAQSQGTGSIVIGRATVSSNNTIALNATEGVGLTVLNDANSMYVVIKDGVWTKLLGSDETIPAARHASLPASDGTYVLKLVISGGVPTLSWVAE